MQHPTRTLLLAGSLAGAAACGTERPTAVSLSQPVASADAQATAGFRTSAPAQAEALVAGAQVTPIITVGDIIPGTTLPWAPTPDGLGGYPERGTFWLHTSHELSSSGVSSNNGGAPFKYARVSKLGIDVASMTVTSGSYPEDGSTQLQRLCSASWIGFIEGFTRGVFLTGEETIGTTNGSVVMAIDEQGNKTLLPHLGAFAHENQIVVPGFPGQVVSIGLDDAAGQSELYMYVAATQKDFMAGNGKLFVFRTDARSRAGKPLHSGNMAPGQVIGGSFVEVSDPADLATPPAQRAASLQAKVDKLGAMPFVRIEDGDWDRRDPWTPAVYFVDTGSPAVTGRTAVGADCGGVCDLAGSVYRLEFDRTNPTRGARLVLVARSQGAATGWASPDNIALSSTSMMLQEDPAYAGFDGSRAPAIWNFTMASNGRAITSITKVAQATQETLIPGAGGKCVDAQGLCWETSGIISTERVFGPGSWLFVVQAHTYPFSYTVNGVTSTYPNESGQLLSLRFPGS